MPPSMQQQPDQPEAPIAEADYPVAPHPPQPHKKRRWLIPFIALVVIALLGAAWKLIPSKDQADNAKQAQANNQSTSNNSGESSSAGEDVPDVKSTKDYSNGFMGLKLKYPDSWTVTEADNGVRLESPGFRYKTEAKGNVSGYFRLYIRKGARTKDGSYIGRGYAVEASQKLTYTNPSADQRSETNLTLFGLDEPTNFAFFMIAGNYSLQKGDTLGPDYGKEAETFIIAGGYSDKSLTDDLAMNPVNPDYVKTSKAYAQAVDIVKSLNLR